MGRRGVEGRTEVEGKWRGKWRGRRGEEKVGGRGGASGPNGDKGMEAMPFYDVPALEMRATTSEVDETFSPTIPRNKAGSWAVTHTCSVPAERIVQLNVIVVDV